MGLNERFNGMSPGQPRQMDVVGVAAEEKKVTTATNDIDGDENRKRR